VTLKEPLEMERPRHVTFLAVLAACGFVATTAFAQSPSAPPTTEVAQPQVPPAQSASSFPPGEWAFGWSVVRPHDSNAHWITQGVESSGVVAVNRWLGAVLFDVSVNHDSGQTADGATWGQTTAAILGGARFSLRRSRLVVPYGQFVVGYGRTSSSVSGTGGSVANAYFVVQPGGGVDIGGESVAAHFEFSVRSSFDESVPSTGFRFVFGLIIRAKPGHDEWR
jgi:hypothetical protein